MDEDIGTLDVELSAHVAHGLPKPDSNVVVALSTREHGLEGQRAARGEDYRVVSATVTFRPADFQYDRGFWIARKTVSVPIVDDALDEEDFEWFYLALQSLPITVPGVHRVYPSGEGLLLGSVGSTGFVPSPRPHPRQRRSVVGAADGRAGGAADGRVQGPAGRA